MSGLLHAIHIVQHWIHDRPTTYVVWTCTVVAAVMVVVIILPRTFRRLLQSGDRAGRRLLLATVLTLMALGLLAWFDSGSRLPQSNSAHASTQSQFAQSITAVGEPFSLLSYHSLNLALSSHSRIMGAVPLLIKPGTWMDLRSHTSFTAAITGIPSNLSVDIYVGRSLAPSLDSQLSAWQRAITHLRAGHVFVDTRTAKRLGVKPGDTLEFAGASGATYWTVQSTVRRGLLLPGPSVVLPLARAQVIAGAGSSVNRLVLLLDGTGPFLPSSVRHAVTSSAASLPPHVVSRPRVVAQRLTVLALAADWTRRLAVAATGIVAICALTLLILGRRRSRTGSAA